MNSAHGFSELINLLPQMLENGVPVSIEPKGRSMLPTIREGDKVFLAKPERLHKYDIVLFTLSDGKAILHRIIGRAEDGSYIMRGDSQAVKEMNITAENIVARVVSIERNGKTVKMNGFWFYVRSFIILNLKYIKRAFC